MSDATDDEIAAFLEDEVSEQDQYLADDDALALVLAEEEEMPSMEEIKWGVVTNATWERGWQEKWRETILMTDQKMAQWASRHGHLTEDEKARFVKR